MLLKRIKFYGGGTSFAEPLNRAYNLVLNTHSKFDIISILFLSDGHAKYPK